MSRGPQAESAMMTPGPHDGLDLAIGLAAAVIATKSHWSALDLANCLPAAVLVEHRHQYVEGTGSRDKA